MSVTSPSMKTAQPSAKAPAPKSWPPFEIWPSLSSEWLAPVTSPPHCAPVLASALPSFASSASQLDFDGAVEVAGRCRNLGKDKRAGQISLFPPSFCSTFTARLADFGQEFFSVLGNHGELLLRHRLFIDHLAARGNGRCAGLDKFTRVLQIYAAGWH
jgi:hypothetical protein